jgi:zinc transport system substrate-binding protein
MPLMRWRLLWGVLCLCAGWPGAAAAAVPVVATIFPLADLVRQIGGDEVEVVTLLPPGASPHTFEPTPEQARQVAKARVFVDVGAGLDGWAARLRAARTEPLTVVTATAGVSLLDGDHGVGGDPHVWLDPLLVRDHIVAAIVDGLVAADPDHRAAFERGAAQLRDALTRLDAEVRALLAPAQRRSYVAFHAAWRYFGRRYDLTEVGVVESFPGKEPSAREIATLVDRARAAHAAALLVEPQFAPRMAEQIAREFGGRPILADPIGGAQVPGRQSYGDLMRYNARAFAEALQ